MQHVVHVVYGSAARRNVRPPVGAERGRACVAADATVWLASVVRIELNSEMFNACHDFESMSGRL